jgi:hypothetical protein
VSELPIKATLKAGTGYDAPWLTVDANDPNDLAFKLKGLIEHESALQLVVEAANALKATNNVAPIAAQQAAVPEPAPQASNGWGSSPAAAQQTQQNAPPQNNGVRYHPEGLLCPSCNAGVIFKSITAKTGKTFELWTCPNQRQKDDGHYSQFAN